jgi:predicted lipoprotein with Yx(FWY)xxD motif
MKGITMRKSIYIFTLLTAAVFFTAGAFADNHAVKIEKKEGVGSYLTDTKGMTLYYFMKDSPGKSACTGSCVDKWPLYYREKVAPPEGVNAGDFTTITREDGKPQTAFRGYPLYYFVIDKAKGDTAGQGMGNVWYVIDPAAFPPKK